MLNALLLLRLAQSVPFEGRYGTEYRLMAIKLVFASILRIRAKVEAGFGQNIPFRLSLPYQP